MVWFLASALSSTESFDTDPKGSVWKIRTASCAPLRDDLVGLCTQKLPSHLQEPVASIETPQLLPGKVTALAGDVVWKYLFNVGGSQQETRVMVMHQEGDSVFTRSQSKEEHLLA